ncbi:18S pre-ribosomal assembly protein gar2-like protein [Heracleum sosnowskyi]|uniref:18S pre-ribosomal assembly protein gar2-like protein n=1 Tax=Heracleum sosnowskyi TaxID=360622 RepID=A0AAD8H9B4_9APIA|nr:18S pre-ribosomal assembly protein gar2-like protein [Heracleum sosnowskyi]
MNPAQPGPTMNDQNGISSHPNGYERIAPLSTELKNKNGYRKAPEHDVYADVDDFTSCNEEEAKESVAASGVHTEMSHEDSTIYTDKNVLESDLPELIVCYKDSIFHDVKDICVDEGMAAESKCLTENVVGGRSTFPSNNYKHRDVTEEADTDISYEDDFKSSSYKDFRENGAAHGVNNREVNLDKDTAYDSDSVELESSSESDKNQDSASVQFPKSLIKTSEEECAVEKITEIVCDSTLLGDDLHSETSLESLLKSARSDDNNSTQQSDQISGAQAPSPVMTEEPNTSSSDNLLDSGVISLNVVSSKLAPSAREEIHGNAIGQQLKSDKKLFHDDGISDNRLVINNQLKRDQGESSFSVAGPLPDLVPYSGHIPFSGSISLRSDSSTTSTRSFAFPVLPNEWNSSPVRMAKGDRRNLRRRRGCNLGLLCCRF